MKKLIITLIACSFFGACSDKLDVAPPNSITEEQIQELLKKGDLETIDLIIGGMANNMPRLLNSAGTGGVLGSDGRYSNILGLLAMRNLEGNDVVFGNRALTGFGGDEYRFLDFISEGVDKNAPYWNYSWNIITAANKMLNVLTDEVIGSSTKLKEYKSRGLIVRAYAYNFLMDNYQDAYLQGGKDKLGVPLYDFYSPVQENKSRATAEETYAFIKKDLNDAERLMTEANIAYTAEISDLDMGVVHYLQAKIALVTGDYPTSIDRSNKILANKPNLITESNYGGKIQVVGADREIRPETNAFLNTAINPEIIFGMIDGEASTIHGAWYNAFGESYGGINEGYARIDNRLYDKIAPSDFRKDAFMVADFGNYIYPSNSAIRFIPLYTNLKFAATHGMGSNDKKQVGRVGHVYFRTSEVWLMKAEAQARSNDESGALATLDELLKNRTKAGEIALSSANYPGMSGMSAIEKVQLQTRIEMWGEAGLEFYNNKRWNISVNRSNSTNHVDKSSYAVSNMTLKIPLDEILYNDKAIQN